MVDFCVLPLYNIGDYWNEDKDITMKEPVTQDELEAARSGDEAALAFIITRHMPFIRKFAHKAVRPGLDFEDAVQEGIIGLFSAIENYEVSRDVTFNTYSSVCIHNAILSAQKAAGRKKHSPLNYSVPIPENQSIPGPEDSTIASEQVSLAMEKIKNKLSSTEKTVLALFLDGFSYEEIARTLGKTQKSVENSLTRARRKLK